MSFAFICAECSMLSKRLCDGMCRKPCMCASSVTIKGVRGVPQKSLDVVNLRTTNENNKHVIAFEILCGGLGNVLLGVCVRLDLIKRVHLGSDVSAQSGQLIIDNYKGVFQGIGRIAGTYELKIGPNAQPTPSDSSSAARANPEEAAAARRPRHC